jgi:hypothetical protein
VEVVKDSKKSTQHVHDRQSQGVSVSTPHPKPTPELVPAVKRPALQDKTNFMHTLSDSNQEQNVANFSGEWKSSSFYEFLS